jgi:hypothetical protein
VSYQWPLHQDEHASCFVSTAPPPAPRCRTAPLPSPCRPQPAIHLLTRLELTSYSVYRKKR